MYHASFTLLYLICFFQWLQNFLCDDPLSTRQSLWHAFIIYCIVRCELVNSFANCDCKTAIIWHTQSLKERKVNGSLLSIGKFTRHSAYYPYKGSDVLITACRPGKEQILIVKRNILIKAYYYTIINLIKDAAMMFLIFCASLNFVKYLKSSCDVL